MSPDFTPYLPALSTTFGLLARPANSVWPYQDKVFALMTPTWSADGKNLTLSYTSTTPSATLDNALADELTASGHKVHALQRIREGSDVPAQDAWLISAGLLLSTPQGQLITFERTITNPAGQVIAWPKALNNPMGRVDALPGATCLKEGAEEIFIARNTRNEAGDIIEINPAMFITGANKQTGISLQTEMALEAKMLRLFAQNNTRLEQPLGHGLFIPALHDPRYDDKLTTITVEQNGVVVDRFKAVAVRSASERTIEIALPLILQPENSADELRYIAREPFGRAVKMATAEEMAAMHYGWAKGLFGSVHAPQQNRSVNLGGILPILQGAVLGMQEGVSRPEEVQVPTTWPESRIKDALKL